MQAKMAALKTGGRSRRVSRRGWPSGDGAKR
jgi:hypothetical protein